MNECVRVGVKGIIVFGIGLTLRDGDREYYYAALDKHFPGLKERYIKEFGNSYEIPSPHSRKLMNIIETICRENNMMYKPDDCFKYMQEFPEKYKQMSIFEL